MDIQTYAAILLVIRVISMGLMAAVLFRQLELFRLPVPKDIKWYRIVLFILALGVFLGNIVPAGIDILTIFGEVVRSAKVVNGIGLIYSLDAAGTSLLSSILIFWLYRMSHTVDKSHTESDHTLMNDDK